MSTALLASWSRIDAWLAAHAPRTRATLQAPVEAERLRRALGESGRAVPAALVALYALAGGQALPRARSGGPQGIFEGYWWMPLAGVDGVLQSWKDWATAAEHGAEWATGSRFPFATDFSGGYLFLETKDEPAVVVMAVEDDEVRPLAESLDAFLQRIATKLEDGTVTIDERLEVRELHEVLFDARRQRVVGELARHSVFDALGIVATVEDVAQVFGPLDTKPAEVFGLAVRLELAADPASIEDFSIESVTLCDAHDRRLRATTGNRFGGGLRGRLAYVWDPRPLPEGARLKVTLARIRRG